MVKTSSLIVSIACAIVVNHSFAADDVIAAGKSKSMICASCHGTAGISHSPLWPNLAAQKAGYLEKQLKAFRSGERKEPTMSAMAKPLSDEDIKALAAYYASLQ